MLAGSSVGTVDLSSYMWFLRHGGLSVVRLTWSLGSPEAGSPREPGGS